jgi:serine/threonine-protein kinase
MATPPSPDRETFLALLRQSGLVSEQQLKAVAAYLPAGNRGRPVARALMELGLLTRFQAERLLAGISGGFFQKQYRILDELGRGGMGRVFKAEHNTMKRVVALKVLSPKVFEKDRAHQLFAREMQAASKLNHPNVVTAFDADEVNGRFFLVLEYVNGPNLDQLVRQKGPLPVGQACDFVRQAALGLEAAHRLGMVHRDIKPANLLLQHGDDDGQNQFGVVKISDFGLARINEPESPTAERPGTILAKANTVMGTPDYLSPEQARDLHKTDIRSDLYSLGCTFYFLLTGRVPFPGGSPFEKLVRHSAEEPTPVEQLRSKVPPEVVAIVRRLMAKRPEGRFQTPRELADALAPFAVNSPASWSAAAQPAADPLPTPPAPDDSDPFGPPTGLDDPSALQATLPPDASPTPVSAVGLSSARRALTDRQKRRLWLAIYWSVGIVGGALLLLTLLGLLQSL